MNLIYSLKNLVTKKLNSNQTRLIRNLVEPPFLSFFQKKTLSFTDGMNFGRGLA